MQISDRKKLIVMALAAWIILIFALSSDAGSNGKTGAIAEYLRSVLIAYLPDSAATAAISAAFIDFVLRKGAHFLEYLVLCLLLLKLGEAYGAKWRLTAVHVLFICLLTANIDELFQSQIQFRSSSVGDSLIDFSGSLVGLAIYKAKKRTKSAEQNR